jgi:hypothetical protein
MIRGPLYHSDYRPLFSGHETFPLRYGWLKKAYDAVVAAAGKSNNRSIFLNDDSIARLGVGKNMVASIRHWATYCAIIKEGLGGELAPTVIGDFLFGDKGVDPYLEEPASLWLIHWLLCSDSSKTTWFWVFNHFMATNFKRDDLVDGLMSLADSRDWRRVSRTTVQRDVECFVRMYESRGSAPNSIAEESLESPMGELALIRGAKGYFHLVRSAKPTLPNGVFAYALDMFWNRHGSSRTLSFEAIAHQPASPGRVFLLDEADLADRLIALEEITDGVFRWSETAGLKQVLRERALEEDEKRALLAGDYRAASKKEAA